MSELPKAIFIVGPTASGKTALSLELAKKFNGEIVSADSRQVYKFMDIGTAKPSGIWKEVDGRKVYMVAGIPHYCMDYLRPDQPLNLAQYQREAYAFMDDIVRRGKVPFVVGGAGLDVLALLDNLAIPSIGPDQYLRDSLAKWPLATLLSWLKHVDPLSYSKIDRKNSRRVIRALEVSLLSGHSFFDEAKKGLPRFQTLQIGIRLEPDVLRRRIEERIKEQINSGFVAEVKRLEAKGYARNLSSMSSIGYAEVGSYLHGEMTLSEMAEKIVSETRRYAKRQMTWFKKDPRIHWVEDLNKRQAEKMIEIFLSAI